MHEPLFEQLLPSCKEKLCYDVGMRFQDQFIKGNLTQNKNIMYPQ